MEGSCSTGQSPQWAVVPVEEEEEEELFLIIRRFNTIECISWTIKCLTLLMHGANMKSCGSLLLILITETVEVKQR
jgi:hypothetical protein